MWLSSVSKNAFTEKVFRIPPPISVPVTEHELLSFYILL